ncbi:phage tail terminator protein [Pseudomonas anguilliseptica]|uniref:Mu-like prophage protein gp37 n=1 Tax=Pseudomonas anguilliseptica TaxID=53406 RepID=A0A1H4UYG1_PSEAG|nr:hypothetical protein [Pseudomonas anguilliseptica]SEC73869.1 hypothetical protein SAMN05421553_1361 [Pseudomonas anguilliseptica]
MNLDNVIERIRATCPSFAQRVAGAAEFAALPQNAKVALPAAFVIPMDDRAGEQESMNRYRQSLIDRVAVVMVLDNAADRRGQAAVTTVDNLRRELWRSLLLWPPGPEYDGLMYEGGQGLLMDGARLYYQLEFAAETELGVEDTAQPGMKADLPRLAGIDVRTDVLNPMVDPNNVPGQQYDPEQPNPRTIGPDGRAEAGATIDLPE